MIPSYTNVLFKYGEIIITGKDVGISDKHFRANVPRSNIPSMKSEAAML
ncbi:MAG: hypothetical protein QOA57_07655 [Nitrososphaeraceae archaeon]|nr:hypothetical protein [Nitrososphaeraceae archaeon]